MLLRRLYDDKLAQASYLVGCHATGEALVVDPHRDLDVYIEAAQQEGLRISHVTETHIHADFASGARELAARTGAQLLLSDEGDADWKYAFAAESRARLLKDGDSFMVGNLKFDVWHTPGHTPEHIAFLVTDTPASSQPIGALTGDFIFVGDVGRPDLLEKAAKVLGTMEAGARTLFRSLQRFKALPDHLQIWPGHGAGSACGKALGAMPSSTLGYERIANWGLQVSTEDEFVTAVLSGQPDPPFYFAQMKRMNKLGPAALNGRKHPPFVQTEGVQRALAAGSPVVDLRSASEFAQGHILGAINIPENKSFTNWAGWLLPYDQPLLLIGTSVQVRAAVRDLSTIGLDDVTGVADAAVIDAWASAGLPVGRVAQIEVAELAQAREHGAQIVDVRAIDEWEAGHIPGAHHIPLGHLAAQVESLRETGRVYLQCQSGGRSAIAASVLLSRGVTDVVNVSGGITAWRQAGLPIERGAVAALA